MDKLTLLSQFIAVVEQGGFAAAANKLGLSPSTLSKSIARLESHLEIKLFNRSTRQVNLTQAGSRYLEIATQVMQTLAESERDLRQEKQEATGLLRLNVPVSYGRLYILPLLSEFKALYPNVKIQLSFTDTYQDMIENGIDLTVRTGRVNNGNLIARKISPIDFLVCAAPSYIEQGIPIDKSNLSQHPWIRFRYPQSGRLMPIIIESGVTALKIDENNQYIVDDGEALADLAAQGLGLTQIPHFIARPWLESGELVSLLPSYRAQEQGVFALYPNREYLPAKISVFVTFLIAKMEEVGESAYHTWAET